MERLKAIRRGGAVRRFHTEPMLHTQTVASHSWGVATLLLDMTEGKCTAQLLAAALYHDVAEYVTGDIPAPAKWSNPALGAELDKMERRVETELDIVPLLTAYEQTLLKVADTLELILHCHEEYVMGNQRAGEIAWRGFEYLKGLTLPEPVELYCLNLIDPLFEDVDRG